MPDDQADDQQHDADRPALAASEIGGEYAGQKHEQGEGQQDSTVRNSIRSILVTFRYIHPRIGVDDRNGDVSAPCPRCGTA